MIVIRRLLLGLMAILFPLIVVGYVITSLVSSGVSANSLLKESGVYTLVGEQMRAAIISSQRIPDQYQALFTKSVNEAVTDPAVESIIQPAMVDIVTWLQQPQETPPPDVILVIKPVKDSLITALETNGLPAMELTYFKSTLTQQVPDQIKLSGLQQLTGTQGAQTTSAGDPEAGFIATVKAIKQAYTTTQTALLIASIVFVVLLVGYMITARLSKVSTILAPALTLSIESGILLAISLVAPMLLNTTSVAVDMQIPLRVLKQVINALAGPSFILFVMMVCIYIITLLMWRRSQLRRQGGPIIKTNLPRR